jgi:hypothetical protein
VRNGAIFKFEFQDTCPRASRLNGCAIHWSRGNAVLQCQQVSFRARLEFWSTFPEVSKAARAPGRARRSFSNEIVPDFYPVHCTGFLWIKIMDKNPVKLENFFDMTQVPVKLDILGYIPEYRRISTQMYW